MPSPTCNPPNLRCTLGLVLLLCASAVAARNEKPRVAIKTFENPSTSQNSTVGNALTEILITELGKTGKFRIVERGAVDEVMKEIDLGSTDWAKNKTFAKKGNLAGAEYFVFGKVTNFGYKEHATQGQVTDYQGTRMVTYYDQRADVQVDFRVVSSETGEVVLAQSGNAHKTNRSYASELAVWNQFNASGSSITSEWSSSLIGRATTEALRDVVRKMSDLSSELRTYGSEKSVENTLEAMGDSEGKILGAVGSDQFVVSLGSGNGLVKGDHLKVFSEVLTKNKKGEVIYREEKEVGNLEVLDVGMKDRAKTKLLGSAPTTPAPQWEGNAVKIDLDYARTLRGATGSASATPAPAGAAAPATSHNNSQIEEFIRKGDRLRDDTYYAQALEQYQKAEAVDPSNTDVMARIVTADLLLRDFSEAEDSSLKLLSKGGPFSVPAVHFHAMNFCAGDLVIQNGQLSYRPSKGDHGFTLPAAALVGVQPNSTSRLRAQTLVIRWKDKDGKEKKYDFLLTEYIQRHPVGLGTMEQAFPTTDETARDTEKLNRLAVHLVQQAVK